MSVSQTQAKGIVLAAGTAINKAIVYANVSNTWYQLIASTSTAIYVTTWSDQQSSGNQVFDLGTGSAGSEIVVASRVSVGSQATFGLTYPIRIPAGTRIAVRTDSAGAGLYFAIQYVNESAVV